LPKALVGALQNLAGNAAEMATLPAGILPMLAYLQANSPKKPGRTLFVVADDNTALEWLRAFTSLHLIEHSTLETAALVSWGVIPYSFTAPDQEKEYHRTRAELLIRSETPCLIVASTEGLLHPIATDINIAEVERTLTPGMHLKRTDFADFLVACGFAHANPVERPGEFCIKGGVVDIFPPDEDLPVRLDFFGDEIETMKTFSHETQRSLGAIAEVRIAPLRPAVAHLADAIANFVAERRLNAAEAIPLIATGGGNLAGYADLYPALRRVQSIAELWQGSTYIADAEAVFRPNKDHYGRATYLFERCESRAKLEPAVGLGSPDALDSMLSAAQAITPQRQQRRDGNLARITEVRRQAWYSQRAACSDRRKRHLVFYRIRKPTRSPEGGALPTFSNRKLFRRTIRMDSAAPASPCSPRPIYSAGLSKNMRATRASAAFSTVIPTSKKVITLFTSTTVSAASLR
jgi:transcription-repair coupling factor (superfamily II helicase)